MPSFVPFFEKACHQVAKLQAAYPARPRLASLKLAMWAFGKAATGHVLGDVTLPVLPATVTSCILRSFCGAASEM